MMGWQVIRQPDGKLGVYSSVVGDWIAKDLSADDVEELFAEDMGADVARRLRKVRQIVQWVADGTPEKAYHQFAMTYEEACAPAWDPDDELEEETQQPASPILTFAELVRDGVVIADDETAEALRQALEIHERGKT